MCQRKEVRFWMLFLFLIEGNVCSEFKSLKMQSLAMGHKLNNELIPSNFAKSVDISSEYLRGF